MIDELKLYELRNKLYHLNTDIDDDLILNILDNKDFEGYEKMDVLYFIYLSIRPSNTDYTNEEIRLRTQTIVYKVSNLSKYNYTEDELDKIGFLYFCNSRKRNNETKDEIINLIKLLEKRVVEDISELPLSIQFVNEELRMILLSLYQYSGDIYDIYEPRIMPQLNIAKERVPLRLQVSEILGRN